jgi:hemerythrin
MLYYEEQNPYVEHLLAEHRRLHTMLRLARSAILQCGGPDRDATTADIVRVLQQVRSEMAHHFADEEAGGCLEEAVSRCPRLSAQAERVQAEHPELLRQIDKLIAQALDSRQSLENRIAFEKEFDELCSLLHAHEAAENDLVRQGFGRAVNGDCNGTRTLPLDV